MEFCKKILLKARNCNYFNISYSCFLYFRKGEMMNHVSLYFLFFSAMYLAYHILKYVLINFFINSNKNFTLEKNTQNIKISINFDDLINQTWEFKL